MTRRADVVVIGAGIAGVSTAFHLTCRQGISNVILVDPRPPLTLTSDKSTECYRNWWPDQPMVGLMNRSIDLLEEMAEESGDVFSLKRPGYLYVTSDQATLDEMRRQAELTSRMGGGAVRKHPGSKPYGDADDGVDLLGPSELRAHHPWITSNAIGALQVRRAGYFSAQQLGAWMLDEARSRGAELTSAEVTGIGLKAGRVTRVMLDDGSRLEADNVVIAAGPMAREVSLMAELDLPLFSELHIKVTFKDHLRVIPRDAGMFIWSDTQRLDWPDDVRSELEAIGRTDVTGDMPVFCHGRPEGGTESPYFVALWEYNNQVMEPRWPLPMDDLYPEVVMRGLSTMVPGLVSYLDGLPEHTMDGGYYTKTRENRPLIGPCGPEGLGVICGFSGFGVMVAAGAGDLAARHISGSALPPYSDDFLLSRYERPEYLAEIDRLGSGQL